MKHLQLICILSLSYSLHSMRTQAFLPVDAIELNNDQWRWFCGKWKLWNFDRTRKDIKENYISTLSHLLDQLIMQTPDQEDSFSSLSVNKVFTLPHPSLSSGQEKDEFLWRLNLVIAPLRAIYENKDLKRSQNFCEIIIKTLKSPAS